MQLSSHSMPVIELDRGSSWQSHRSLVPLVSRNAPLRPSARSEEAAEANPRALPTFMMLVNTLVVETTNFTDKTNFRGAPRSTRQDIFASNTLQVVERFTLVDADTIRYQFTVKDPSTWISPWSGEISVRRLDGPLFEYACHEGNDGLPNILRGARAQETHETSSR